VRGQPQIVSNNLCSDQYLLALNVPRREVLLSPSSADRTLSFYAGRAREIGKIADSTETVLASRPDLLISADDGSPVPITLAHDLGIKTFIVPSSPQLEAIPDILRSVGLQIGRRAVAGAVASRIAEVLNSTKGLYASRHLTVLLYDHGGYALSERSTVGMLFTHLGIEVVHPPSRSDYVSISIEHILAIKPDLIFFVSATDTGSDLDATWLSNPAIERLYPPNRRVTLPLALTLCTGPTIAAAIQKLAQQIGRI
jgi:iron complex transport system substrate-binding protein